MKQAEVLYTGLDPSRFKTEGKLTHLPLIRTVPRSLSDRNIHDALTNFTLYTHLIFTSQTALNLLIDSLPQFGFSLKDWKEKTIVCVGTATAEGLQKKGLTAAITARRETAEGIIDELSSLNLNDSFFFWPHSAQARPILIDFFQTKSVLLRHCAIYDTIPVSLERLPDLNWFDEIVFTSPSTVAAFLHIFGKLPSNKILTCIGPVTKNYLENIDRM
jgi:uroporphyrinogen-III synthase